MLPTFSSFDALTKPTKAHSSMNRLLTKETTKPTPKKNSPRSEPFFRSAGAELPLCLQPTQQLESRSDSFVALAVSPLTHAIAKARTFLLTESARSYRFLSWVAHSNTTPKAAARLLATALRKVLECGSKAPAFSTTYSHLESRSDSFVALTIHRSPTHKIGRLFSPSARSYRSSPQPIRPPPQKRKLVPRNRTPKGFGVRKQSSRFFYNLLPP